MSISERRLHFLDLAFNQFRVYFSSDEISSLENLSDKAHNPMYGNPLEWEGIPEYVLYEDKLIYKADKHEIRDEVAFVVDTYLRELDD